MSAPHSVIQSHFQRVETRWKRLRTIARCSIALCGIEVLALLLGQAIWRGWIVHPHVATLFGLLLAGLAGACFLVILVATAGPVLDRGWLARASENVNRHLMDRLNTLTHLERARWKDPEQPFYVTRIRSQAAMIIGGKTSLPFSATNAWIAVALALALGIGTCWFYIHWKPWRNLASESFGTITKASDTTFELARDRVEKTNSANAPWGEVRITEPGRDLKLTKVDVVAMKIEAASNQSLQAVRWEHSVNGGTALKHALPTPSEPSYAAYDPVLYLDELQLSNWDVVSYFAESEDGSGIHSSDIYFIEIRPFRSDLAKLPGGEGGQAGKTLAEMSGLIERQQQILRETRHYLGTNYSKPELQKQDREKLGSAEEGLRESTEYQYAKTATTLENQPIGDILDALAKAEEAMRRATDAITEDSVPGGQQYELTALQDLISSRKNLQKFISEHPEAFQGKPSEQSEPTADPIKALSKVTEYRNREQAAREKVDELLKNQQTLRDSVAEGEDAQRRTTGAEQQSAMRQELQKLREDHPQLFRGAQPEADAAEKQMAAAEDALRQDRSTAFHQNRAVDRLQDLQHALAQHDDARAMEQALRMKQLLDQQTKQMESAAKDGNSKQEMQKLTQAANATTGELKKFAESDPPGFGPNLKEALSGTSDQQLRDQLRKAGQAESSSERQGSAGQAAESMKRVSSAFDQSVPQAKPNGKSGQSESGNEDSLSKGLRELQSLMQHGQSGHSMNAEDEAKERDEALADLREGLGHAGDQAAAAAIIRAAEEELKDHNRPVNIEVLKKLLDQIENFRVELSERDQKKALEAAMTHADPTKISPLYRDRVQEYYRKLSEK